MLFHGDLPMLWVRRAVEDPRDGADAVGKQAMARRTMNAG